MFRAIPRRRTNRLPLDGREPPEGLVTALLREARREARRSAPSRRTSGASSQTSSRRATGAVVVVAVPAGARGLDPLERHPAAATACPGTRSA